jgi:hypothetical protein
MSSNLKQDTLYNPKNVVACCKIYDSKSLLFNGITCKCTSIWKSLYKKFNWVTILLYNSNGDTIYIETTRDVDRRIKNLLKCEWFNLENSRIGISVALGENILINLFKPTRNLLLGKKYESDLLCIGGSTLVYRKLYNISSTKLLQNKLLQNKKYNNSAGILFTTIPNKFIDHPLDWCFKVDVDICNCRFLCGYRQLLNTWTGSRYEWYPIELSNVKKEYIQQQQQQWTLPLDIPINIGNKKFVDYVFDNRVIVDENTRVGYKKAIHGLLDIGLLENIDCVESNIYFLEQRYTKSTLKQQILVLRIYLRHLSILEFSNKSILHSYTREYQKLITDYNNILQDQQKNSREAENWVTLEDLEIVYNKLKNIDTTNENSNSFQEYFGIKLLLFQQTLRNDYGTLKYKNFDKDTDNYVNDNEIIWNDYKTRKKHGRVSFPVKEALLQDFAFIIEKRIAQGSENGFIFINKNGQGMGNNNFGVMIRNVLKTHLQKSIGVQMIRKIKVSDARKNDLTLKQEQELAKDMMHTSGTSRTVYRKI